MTALNCKLHDHSHAYTVCPVCQHQYCAKTWPACPSTQFHVAKRKECDERARMMMDAANEQATWSCD